ncbi:hypothetical protein PFISCL1PPCAC_19315, partial [Pristionchus fissidentatus]
LRARVNKKLDEIELSCKYRLKSSLKIIEERPANRQRIIQNTAANCFIFIVDVNQNADIDGLKRITKNNRFKDASVRFRSNLSSLRRLMNVISGFEFEKLYLSIEHPSFEKSVITDDFLWSVSSRVTSLHFDPIDPRNPFPLRSITPSVLCRIYEGMATHSIPLRSLSISIDRPTLCTVPLNNLLGVSMTHNGRVKCTRHIEVFRYDHYYGCDINLFVKELHFFDGRMEITVDRYIFIDGEGSITFRRHENEEELEEAKNGEDFEIVDVIKG